MCQSARAGGGRAVARYDVDSKQLHELTNEFQSKRYIAPNDLCVDERGRIYFTDPYYDGDKSQPTSGVYRLDPDGRVTLVIDNLLKPNGIAITPDQLWLYVSDRGTQKLHRYRIGDDLQIHHDRVQYDFSPDRGIDGMALDIEGNIYGAAGEGSTTGLFVISKEGKLLLHQPMPEFSTNVAFGGADFRDLYITATTSVYKLRAEIEGVPPVHVGRRAFIGEPKKILDSGAGEGPAWHPDVGLVFSGDGGINRLTEGNTVARHADGTSTNGLLFDHRGNLLRCENRNGRISRENSKGEVMILADSFLGKPFNQPNDITLDRHGRIYFSDPKYGPRDDMRQFDERGEPVEGVYRIDIDGSVHRIIGHEVDRPNGVLVTSDDRYLFVADNNNSAGGARALYRFRLNESGFVDSSSRRLVYSWGTGRGPDGIVQDDLGRIYVAGGLNLPHPPHESADLANRAGIYVFTVDGELVDFLAIPRDEVTNCTFGGTDWRNLYITAGGSLWTVRVNAHGALPLLR